MPQIQIKITGRGHNVKTVFINLDDVSKKMKIDPLVICSFIGYKKSAKFGSQNNNEYFIGGEISIKELHEIMGLFMQKIILCKTCNLPEISIGSESKKEPLIYASCNACGMKYYLTLSSKFSKYIQKFLKAPPPKKVTAPEEDYEISDKEVVWYSDLSEKEIQIRKEELVSESVSKLLD